MEGPTLVFDLKLNEGDDYTEWSYLDLVQQRLSKNNGHQENSSDSTENNRLSEIAKSLEKKYADLFVAPNISTKVGGFFVHSGNVEGLEEKNAEFEAPWSPRVLNQGGASSSNKCPSSTKKKEKSKQLLVKAVQRLSKGSSSSQPKPKMQHLDSVFDEVISASAVSATTPDQSLSISTDEHQPIPITPLVDLVDDVKESVSTTSNEATLSKDLFFLNNLSKEVLEIIDNFKPAHDHSSNNRSLFKVLDAELLRLSSALTTGKVSQSTRSALFGHLEKSLQLKPRVLLRRLKKLKESVEDKKINPLFDNLADIIAQAMPAIIEAHNRDRATYEERVKQWQALHDNPEPSESVEQPNSSAPGTATAQKKPAKPGPPRKVFRWSKECREAFDKITICRLQSHQILNVKVAREEYIRSLFPTLIPFWPDGWISNAALWRTALPAFQRFSTENPLKTTPKRPIPSTTTTTPTTTTIVNNAPESSSVTSTSNVGQPPSSPLAVAVNAIAAPPQASSYSASAIVKVCPSSATSISTNKTITNQVSATNQVRPTTPCSAPLNSQSSSDRINATMIASIHSTSAVQNKQPGAGSSSTAARIVLQRASSSPTTTLPTSMCRPVQQQVGRKSTPPVPRLSASPSTTTTLQPTTIDAAAVSSRFSHALNQYHQQLQQQKSAVNLQSTPTSTVAGNATSQTIPSASMIRNLVHQIQSSCGLPTNTGNNQPSNIHIAQSRAPTMRPQPPPQQSKGSLVNNSSIFASILSTHFGLQRPSLNQLPQQQRQRSERMPAPTTRPPNQMSPAQPLNLQLNMRPKQQPP